MDPVYVRTHESPSCFSGCWPKTNAGRNAAKARRLARDDSRLGADVIGG
jgi:hypothetical protein